VAICQSGETIDVVDAVRGARRRGARVAALVNVEGSTLWRLADCVVPLAAGPERCVLATKSFTAQLGVVLLTAYELAGAVEKGAPLDFAGATENAGVGGVLRRVLTHPTVNPAHRVVSLVLDLPSDPDPTSV